MLNQLLNLSNFGLTNDNVSSFDERTFIVKKWNWDYEQALNFQKACVALLQDQGQYRVLICCNHPNIFTNGRGLQKAKKGQSLELVDFNPAMSSLLPFPVHQITRGGGLTFHHPGQYIFYPIVKLNPKTLSLSKMIDDIFDAARLTLESWGIDQLSSENELLGLWRGKNKIASMGIAIDKLTTFHGMALNLYKNDEMKKAMSTLNPCGLNPETYISAEELRPLDKNALEDFHTEFIKRLQNAW
jgi:lipoyl(octanoyl) transferase